MTAKKKENKINLEINNKSAGTKGDSVQGPGGGGTDVIPPNKNVVMPPVVELMSYLGKIVELSKSTAINTTDALNNVMDKNTPIAEYNYACYDEYPIFFQDLLKSLATIEKSLISVNDDLSKVRFEY